jgi:hypothetical protein
MMRKELVLLFYMTCSLWLPARADDNKKGYTIEDVKAGRAPFTWLSPIWSELVSFTTPSSFKIVTEQVKGNFYIREAVLRDESAERWTQMVTVTGVKGAASNPAFNPQYMKGQIVAGAFKRVCPTAFSEKEIGALTISGLGQHEAYATLAGCGTAQNGGYAHSEAALLIFIKGTEDSYTLQWAERGVPSNAPLDLSDGKWQDRLKTLNLRMIARR